MSGGTGIAPALRVAYREAEYLVFDAGQPILTRIGEASPALARLLDREGARQAALLTACNPLSQPLSDRENARRMAALRSGLDAAGRRWLEAEGRAADGRWAEPGVLLLDPAAGEALALCQQWQQHAWVAFDAQGRGALQFTAELAALRLA